MPAWTAQTGVLHQTHDAAVDCIHAAPSLHALGNGRCIENEDGFLFIHRLRSLATYRSLAFSPSRRTAKRLVRPMC